MSLLLLCGLGCPHYTACNGKRIFEIVENPVENVDKPIADSICRCGKWIYGEVFNRKWKVFNKTVGLKWVVKKKLKRIP